MEEEAPNQKTKKKNIIALTRRTQTKGKKIKKTIPKSKNKQKPSYPKPNGLKPRAIKWKKKPKIKKQKKPIIS